jgi:hypothetical protein
MNEKNLFERTKKGSANVQRFYENKLHAWAFDCQQNQSPINLDQRTPRSCSLCGPRYRLRLLQCSFTVQRFRPKPPGGNVIPIKVLARPMVGESDFEAAASRHSFVFDNADAVSHPGGYFGFQMAAANIDATRIAASMAPDTSTSSNPDCTFFVRSDFVKYETSIKSVRWEVFLAEPEADKLSRLWPSQGGTKY